MSESCEQKARDLLERLSGCTYYDDPQQLSAGDVVELAQMFAEIERLKRLNSSYVADHGKAQDQLRKEIERLRGGLRGIRREFGHHSINNGTSFLGLFIDALVANDVEYVRQMERDKGIY